MRDLETSCRFSPEQQDLSRRNRTFQVKWDSRLGVRISRRGSPAWGFCYPLQRVESQVEMKDGGWQWQRTRTLQVQIRNNSRFIVGSEQAREVTARRAGRLESWLTNGLILLHIRGRHPDPPVRKGQIERGTSECVHIPRALWPRFNDPTFRGARADLHGLVGVCCIAGQICVHLAKGGLGSSIDTHQSRRCVRVLAQKHSKRPWTTCSTGKRSRSHSCSRQASPVVA
jgi:hypothetical protein